MPYISVVMPLYNKEYSVERAVHSLLDQTVTDFEAIIVNDGSTDRGADRARAVHDERIRVIDQPNAGVSAARNRGIDAARSEIIAFLDTDDEWDRDFLAAILHMRESFPTCEVYATNYSFCRNRHKRTAVIRGLPEGFTIGILPEYFAVASRSDPPLWTSAVAVSRRAIQSVGGFPAGVTAGEDLLTWARLAARYDIAYNSAVKAHFWEPLALSDRPGRIPQTPDIVGQELERLMQEAAVNRLQEIKKYLSLWHRMRANIYIRLGEIEAAREELGKAMTHSRDSGLYIYHLITQLPRAVAPSVLKGLRHVSCVIHTATPLFLKGS
jgi:glycosyltransferase involved in cell wall biosynthesis